MSDPSRGNDAATPVATLEAWTAAELMKQTFALPRWAVPGLIPEGVMFLAGPPKVGKSWLGLGLAVAVAQGGHALGSIPTDSGQVLYLALEDTPRRLQNRLRKVLGDEDSEKALRQLTLAVQCPPLPAGGSELIRQWLEQHRGARLVIIDVFARIRGPIPSGGSQYAADYAAVNSVKKLADEFGVAIVLIHHMRKMASDDFLNEISGTLGLSGAADTIAVLKRARGDYDGTLAITGRDVEENEYAMKFDAENGAWQLLGKSAEHGLRGTRKQILDHIRDTPGCTPKRIADSIHLDHELVKKTVKRMADDGQLQQKTGGRYYLPDAVPTVPDA